MLGGGNGDYLTGGIGANTVRGEGGSDIFNGGAERDSIFGGTGRDTIILSPEFLGSQSDIIRDFDLNLDELGVSDISIVSELSIANNGSDTASLLTNSSGELIAIILGVTGLAISDLTFVEI